MVGRGLKSKIFPLLIKDIGKKIIAGLSDYMQEIICLLLKKNNMGSVT